jgi:hypothetical protein
MLAQNIGYLFPDLDPGFEPDTYRISYSLFKKKNTKLCFKNPPDHPPPIK